MFRSLLSPFWSPSDEVSDANKSSLSDKDSQDSQELSPEDGEIDSNPDINGQRDDQHREEVTTIHKKASYVSFPPLLSDSKYDALPVESEESDNASAGEGEKYISNKSSQRKIGGKALEDINSVNI